MVLAEFSFLHSQNKCDRLIIVAPNTFKKGWLEEIEKHGFKFDVHIWRSEKKSAAADWLNGRHALPPVLIINYQAARMPGVTRALQIWAARGVAYLAIDESIQIKGFKTRPDQGGPQAGLLEPHNRRANGLPLRPHPDGPAPDARPPRPLGAAESHWPFHLDQLLLLPRPLLPDGRLAEQGGDRGQEH